jgi:transcriptional regulator with XRE-family HTH domain
MTTSSSPSFQTPITLAQFNDEQRCQLGQRLRELRQAKGWSANEAARTALGLGENRHAAITRIERGESIPSDERLLKLTTAYGITLHALLGSVGDDKSASDPTDAVPAKDFVSTEGEDLRHDREGWTSTRAHAPRFTRHR